MGKHVVQSTWNRPAGVFQKSMFRTNLKYTYSSKEKERARYGYSRSSLFLKVPEGQKACQTIKPDLASVFAQTFEDVLWLPAAHGIYKLVAYLAFLKTCPLCPLKR